MRLLNLDKSPCLCHPDYFGLECPHHKKDKNEEPCSNCKLPSKYDDMVSAREPRKWFFPSSEKSGISKKSKAQTEMDRFAQKNGYENSLEMILEYRDLGYSIESISEKFNVSTHPVRRVLGRTKSILATKGAINERNCR